MAQPFSESDRFGKSYGDIDTMGHERWVAWFTDPGRAGGSGRVQAEKIYALAVDDGNEKRMASLSPERRRFIEEVRNNFANLTKYAFVFRTLRDQGEAFSLQVAESGSAINLTLRELIRGSRATSATSGQGAPTARAAFQSASRRYRNVHGIEGPEFENGLKGVESCLDRLDKLMANRPKAEKAWTDGFIEKTIVPLAFGDV